MDLPDYVVVGAGAAGCAVAGRLAADPSVRVVLLEAGPPDDRREIAVPAAFGTLLRSELDWDFRAVPQPGLAGRASYWARGRTLGGSTSINAMMYLRGVPADYDGWADAGATGWAWDDVLPYFRRAERNSRGADRWHGGTGPLHVQDARYRNPLTRAFLAAAEAAGIPANPDFNGAVLDGAGPVQVTQRAGRRWSAADAYLRPGRENLRVVTGAHVRRVAVEDGHAVGVEFRRGGRTLHLGARREVVLAAGVVGSPQLLLLSGIGPAAHLRELGIDVVADLPGVGANLRDHVACPVVVRTDAPVSLLRAGSPAQKLRYLLGRRGMLASNVAEAAAFLRTRPGLPAPDLELQFAPVVFREYGLEPPTEHGMTIGVTLVAPRSVGRLALRSPDPDVPPLIDPRYLSDPEGHDLGVLRAGVRRAQELFATEPLAGLVSGPLDPGRVLRADAEVDAHVRATADGWWHGVGTCRAGTDPLAVVDPALAVRGVAGLRVADASIMPAVPRGHTAAAAVMIGERAADLVRAAVPARFTARAAGS